MREGAACKNRLLPSTVVASRHGRICGFASIGASRELGPDTGELLALYVDPGAWGVGAGRALVPLSPPIALRRTAAIRRSV
ncbi:MAG TPA: GNAT family N-acetyltransferase [Gemmatimonadaceae bacterium]|nr:GNAT family N-acetyltransferase [Gemmatimonadaceae bacterium]